MYRVFKVSDLTPLQYRIFDRLNWLKLKIRLCTTTNGCLECTRFMPTATRIACSSGSTCCLMMCRWRWQQGRRVADGLGTMPNGHLNVMIMRRSLELNPNTPTAKKTEDGSSLVVSSRHYYLDSVTVDGVDTLIIIMEMWGFYVPITESSQVWYLRVLWNVVSRNVPGTALKWQNTFFDFQCSSEFQCSDSIYFQVFGAGTPTTSRTGSSNSSAVKWLSTSSRIQRDSGIASAPVWAVQCRRTHWQRECCLSNLKNRTPSLWKRHSKPVIPSTQLPMKRHTLSPSNCHCSMECIRQRARWCHKRIAKDIIPRGKLAVINETVISGNRVSPTPRGTDRRPSIFTFQCLSAPMREGRSAQLDFAQIPLVSNAPKIFMKIIFQVNRAET